MILQKGLCLIHNLCALIIFIIIKTILFENKKKYMFCYFYNKKKIKGKFSSNFYCIVLYFCSFCFVSIINK